MNRIPYWAVQPLASDESQTEPYSASATHSHETRRAFFSPLHYEANYAYPLLVWLHGAGGEERQLRRVMPFVSLRNYVAVAPRGTVACPGGGFCWQQSERGIAQAEQAVFDAIEAAGHKFHIHPRRVFLGGYRDGGTMAFRLGLKHAHRFGGTLSIGGPFPEGHCPLAGLNAARHMPLFIAHGRDAVEYPVQRTCEELRLFHAAGMSVTLRQYPCGDELDSQMLHDLDVWLMEQVTGGDTSGSRRCASRPEEAN